MIRELSFNNLLIAITALAAALVAGPAAFADDSSTQKLPGVAGDYRIVKPTPQPEPDDALPAGGNGQFKIGDTDVRIFGDITVDVGAGGIKPSSH